MIRITVVGETIWFHKGKAYTRINIPCSTTMRVRTIAKARRIARGIINRWPHAEVHILRRGERWKSEIWTRGRTKLGGFL